MTEERWVWVPFEVDRKFDGFRIDQFLARRLAGYSRTRVQGILAQARVLRDNRCAKSNTRVRGGDKIQIAYLRRPEKPLPAEASIEILFEDEDLLIINKPGDLLSHPTDKIVHNTVLGVLRQMRPDLPAGQAGLSKLHLLHRLDRETSGVLALAKNAKAARVWTRNMERRLIHKEYIALVHGVPSPAEGVITLPIGRQGGEIKVRQGVNVPGAVQAVTHYSVMSQVVIASGAKQSVLSNAKDRSPRPPDGRGPRDDDRLVSVVRLFPESGRLHQIRVHLAAIGHPVLGDPLYTGDGEIYKKLIAGKCTAADRASLGFPRVALHAAALSFSHPVTQKEIRVEAPLPEDMESLISAKLSTR